MSKPNHPSAQLLSRFGRGCLSRRRNREVVRHLLAECGECRQVTSGFLPPVRPAADPRRKADYDPAFQGALSEVQRMEGVLRAERSEAPESLRVLLAQPFDRQQAMVFAGNPGFHT